jgi:hypothetical protein
MAFSNIAGKGMNRAPTRVDLAIALGLGLAAFGLYFRTLLPGLLPNDGAEFQTLAYTLDHAHTTGYEVYMILARLFILLPAGSVAYRVNLFSAFMAAGTVGLLFLAARTLSGSRWGAALAAAALAVSGTFWSQAIIAEVYTAGSVFSAAILFLLLMWEETHRGVYLFSAGILGGMGIGVHGSVILAAPAVAVLLLLHIQDLRRWWKPALAGAGVGILLLVAAFTIVDLRETNASEMNTYISSISRWDMTPAQIDSYADRFAFLIFARQWRIEMFADPGTVVPQNFYTLGHFFNADFALPVRLLILIGWVGLLRRRPKLAVFFLAAVAFHLIYTLNYRIGDIYIFFISLYLLILPMAAEGVALFSRGLRRLPGRAASTLTPLVGALFILLALLPFSTARLDALRAGEIRFDFMGLPANYELTRWHQLIRFNTRSLPKNAVVLMGWENIYAYAYAANVELGRPDLLFIEAYPYAHKDGMADSLFDYLKGKMKNGCPVIAYERYDDLERGGFQLQSTTFGISEMFMVEER